MLFTLSRLYKDFIPEEEGDLKSFYRNSSRKQMIAFWTVLLSVAIAMTLWFMMFLHFSALTNLIILTLAYIAIIVFEGNKAKLEQFPRLMTLMFFVMLHVCTSAASVGIVFFIQIYKDLI